MTELDIFHFDDDRENFEDKGFPNGGRTWYARDFMAWLGYANYQSFLNVLNKAIGTCMTLKIPVQENFAQVTRSIDGVETADYKLSRFACYLAAMNGDPKKPNVAKAQVYFATLAQSFQLYIEQAEDVERVSIRDEVSDREGSLSGVAYRAGVTNYAFFQNSGYRGMYNMNIADLRRRKDVPGKRSPLDFMGKEELAANLFRITQTEARIKTEGVRGQFNLEHTAESVGQMVRDTMKRISGHTPENLPPAADIAAVRKELKSTSREFKKLDKPKHPPKAPTHN